MPHEMSDDRAKLARIVSIVADDLDALGYAAAGVVRHAARVIAQHRDPTGTGDCPTCHGPVEQPARGRRRIYCSAPCRHRSRKGA